MYAPNDAAATEREHDPDRPRSARGALREAEDRDAETAATPRSARSTGPALAPRRDRRAGRHQDRADDSERRLAEREVDARPDAAERDRVGQHGPSAWSGCSAGPSGGCQASMRSPPTTLRTQTAPSGPAAANAVVAMACPSWMLVEEAMTITTGRQRSITRRPSSSRSDRLCRRARRPPARGRARRAGSARRRAAAPTRTAGPGPR